MATGDWFKQLAYKNPYDTYLCREPAWIIEIKKIRASPLVADKVFCTTWHYRELADRICEELTGPHIPIEPPKPKSWIGRLVDWACRVVK